MARTRFGRLVKFAGLLAATALVCAGAPPAQAADAVYTATLQPMNAALAGGSTTGTARITVHGDRLTIHIDVKGAPPNIEHWQHFHGFKDAQAASCATQAADVNHDGAVDLIETGPASGTTMVPFNAAPAAMDIPANSYPKADAKGHYVYSKTVSLKAMQAAFAKAFPGQDLDLDRRVILIHGVPAATRLPATVASLGPIPAAVTLPIACGKLLRAAR